LLAEPRPLEHSVKFYEKGDRPLEILTNRQWFVRTLDFQDDLIRRGTELKWHPPHMRSRFENWVHGLNQDWAVSRQRFFGVPFPIWYRLDEDGSPLYDEVLTPAPEDLPIDPTTDVPPGFDPTQRDRPGGFTADPDVMDTWATSSLTPQIIAGFGEDPDLFARVFPTDLRPQGHDIIRTWLFYSILRSHIEQDCLPWTDAAISGWVVDPNRKKMSKSKGNAVTPDTVLEEFGPDAARYWAASGAIGADTTFDTSQMRIGRRLAIKILNASRFVVELGEPGAEEPSDPVDLAMIAELAGVAERVTEQLERYEHSRALEIAERSFWSFCSDYLELVKSRAYGDAESSQGQGSAIAALRLSLSVHLRLLAPFLPFVTEEAWSWWRPGSVHRAAWPMAAELSTSSDPAPLLLADTFVVLDAIRKAKSAARRPMRAPVREVQVEGPQARIDSVHPSLGDLGRAGNVGDWAFVSTGEGDLNVSVVLAEEAPLPEGDQR
jgi:valyl-tRNA synthetase